MNLVDVLDHAAPPPQPGATLVAKRMGIDSKCRVCVLLAELLLPGACLGHFSSDTKWQLRSCNMHFSSVPSQARRFLSEVQAGILYAGDGQRDRLKHFNDEGVEKKGYLAFARTKDLQAYISQDASTSERAQSRFIPEKYSPTLVSRWLDYRKEEMSTGVPASWQEIAGMSVIDCETFEIVDRTSDMAYFALSYVWALGNARKVARDYSGAAEEGQRYLPSTIPLVVHEAMVVVRDLGHRYLWVDQFCIDQDGKDKAEHISKMDQIYASATLTIIAASSEGSLPGVGSTPRRSQRMVDLGEVTIFETTPLVNHAVRSSTCNSRGWCFQESVLSTCRLYFTDYQVLFQTSSLALSDTFPIPARDELDIHGLVDITATYYNFSYDDNVWLSADLWDERLQQIDSAAKLDDPRGRFATEFELYQRLLQVYTTKKLSFPSDVIHAWKGVLNIFQRSDVRFKVVAGLPLLDATFITDNPDELDTVKVSGTDEVGSATDVGQMTSKHASISSRPSTGATTPTNLSSTTSSSVASSITSESLQLFQLNFFITTLSWEYVSDQPPSRRLGFPSWSWAGWEGSIKWDDALSEHRWLGQTTRVDLKGIEIGTAGDFIEWTRVPATLGSISTRAANQVQDLPEARYLIGRAYIVPMYLFIMEHTWSRLQELSKLYALCNAVKAMLSKSITGIDYVEGALRGTINDLKSTKPLRELLRKRRRMLCKIARVLAGISKLHNNYLSKHRVSRLDVNVPQHFEPWKLRRPIGSASAADRIAAKEAIARLGTGVSARLESSGWDCLLLAEGEGTAKLLIVQWENDGEEGASYQGHRLRTCSRVGTISLDMHHAKTADFAVSRLSETAALEQVYFRLG